LGEGIQHKILLKLLEFNYSIDYKKGKENIVADALSSKHSHLGAITVITPSWIEAVELSYTRDPQCQELLQKLTITPTSDPYYALKVGVIRYKARIYIAKDETHRQHLLESLHASAIGGHSGIVASYQRIKCLFYWPRLKKDT
jgi:hypothetical protein